MPTASAPADWSSRPVDDAVSAELLGSARAAGEGLLFTATPGAELDEIGRWQRYRDVGFVGMCRAIAGAFERARAEEREFVADEVGLAIGATSTAGAQLVATALGAAELPGLLEAVEDGLLTERHVLSVLRELDKVELTVEQRQAVVLIALARFDGQAPGELQALVGRLVLQVDLAAAAAREAKAT